MKARSLTALAVIAGMVLAFEGCGGGGKGGDQDANDLQEEDTSTDQTTDPPPDVEPDSAPDVAPDTEPDSEPDVTPDVPMDTPADWPTDVPADWPVETSSACAAVGGFCTAVRWEICPAGYEPVDPDPHSDCGSEGTAGWCCVVAPYSTCSASGAGNCVVGTSCTGCWGPVTGYTCEVGRVCCNDICD